MIPVSVDEVAFVRSDTLSGAWFTPELDAPEAPDATIMLAGVISISNKPPMPAKRIPPVNPTLCKKRRAPLQGLGIPF